MSINFVGILTNILTVGTYVEIVANGNAVPEPGHNILLVGMLLSTGSKASGELVKITNEDQGSLYFGPGSQLDEMIRKGKRVDPDTTMWAVGLAEDDGGTAASGAVVFSGTATANGSAKLYVGGRYVEVGIAIGDTPLEIVAAATAKLNADTGFHVTATDSQPNLDLTCKWKGESGNSIDVRVNYLDTDELPAGITATVTAMNGGAVDPSVQPAIDAMAGTQYETIASGIMSAANLALLKDLLLVRWGPMGPLEGELFIGRTSTLGTSKTDALAAGVAVGEAHNSPFLCVMEGGLSPSTPWAWASVTAAIDAKQTQLDVNLPRQTDLMPGILPTRPEHTYDRGERQSLLEVGVATHVRAVDGTARVERLVTTYTTDANNVPDTSFQDVLVVRTLAYMRFSARARMAIRFPKYKIAADSFQPPAGSKVCRPIDVRRELILLASRDWTQRTIIQNVQEVLVPGLIVQLHNNDPATGRIDARIPAKVIRALRVTAMQIAFS